MSDFVRVNLLDQWVCSDAVETLGDGTLIAAITTLTDLLLSVPTERQGSVRFEILHDGGYFDSGSSVSVKAWYDRPKTTTEVVAEEAERTERARQDQLHNEAQERRLLATLKAKYDVA